MIRYGLHAVPVAAVAFAVTAVAGLLWMVDRWSPGTWPLAGVAVALLGATAARLADEPAASIVDSLPRALWWRTVARLPYAAVLVGVWLAGVAVVGIGFTGRPDVVGLQGVGAVVLGVAITTALRRRGHSRPGAAVGSAFLVVVMAFAVANPATEWLPVFPFGPDDPWRAAGWLWGGLVAVGVILLLASCVEGRVRTADRSR
jgi:hypothetical protein